MDLYFGCWNGPGHHLYDPHGRICRPSSLPDDFPCPPDTFDTGFIPPRGEQIEGAAYLNHINGWTVLSFWDRSADSRPKSCSNFISRGLWSFKEMCRGAAVVFPGIWKRYSFPIVEAELRKRPQEEHRTKRFAPSGD